ncbi:DUF1223 domain-containing protein [Aliiroseovarius crassostreae]|uniref:DUF1223 domain-containing protein n=1 Tax=Aliiroseovarius crassostreae TaxID=154981 RepID=UPI003C7D2924
MRAIYGTALAMMMTIGSAMAGERSLVVVELFTSQGCSSCPPADQLLSDMSSREDLLPLAFHVDYWDYIGWKDTFAQPQFTDRQEGYRRAVQARYKYTPQMVIGGVTHAVGNRPMEVFDALEKHRDLMGQVMLSAEPDDQGGAVVKAYAVTHNVPEAPMVALLVNFMPRQTVMITRGENAGHQITYSNVVTRLDAVASWDGAGELELTLPTLGEGAAALILQSITDKGYPGPVQAAIRLN